MVVMATATTATTEVIVGVAVEVVTEITTTTTNEVVVGVGVGDTIAETATVTTEITRLKVMHEMEGRWNLLVFAARFVAFLFVN